MTIQKANYSAEHIGPFEDLLQRDFMGFHGKYFIGKELGLTGSEVSLNRLPAGKGIPFVHAHKKNEELYIVLRGNRSGRRSPTSLRRPARPWRRCRAPPR